MNGGAFLAQHAMPRALLLVVADQGANCGQGIVLKENLPCLGEFILFEQLDYLGDWRVDGAALLTHGLFAV